MIDMVRYGRTASIRIMPVLYHTDCVPAHVFQLNAQLLWEWEWEWDSEWMPYQLWHLVKFVHVQAALLDERALCVRDCTSMP